MISVECCDMSNEEIDGEEEDDDEIDPQKLLGTWLGELESLKLGLENGGSENVSLAAPSAANYFTTAPRMDSYRFSMANLEDSQDGELDAILGELCDLENQFTRELFSSSKSHQRSSSSVSQSSGVSSLDPRLGSQGGAGSGLSSSHSNPRFSLHSRSSSTGGGVGSSSCVRAIYEDGGSTTCVAGSTVVLDGKNGPADNMVGGVTGGGGSHRTDSPDNDSAFSDTVSMLSSESSASSGTGNAGSDTGQRGGGGSALVRGENHSSLSNTTKRSSSLTSSPTRLNLFIKAFTADGSAKSLLVDEKMVVSYVTKLLVDKNHVNLDLKWSIVEQVPELYMERVFEDHENLVENLLLWTRDSSNKLLFLERSDKYDLFVNPELYLLSGADSKAIKEADYDDDSRHVLIEEFFSGGGVCVPEVEGHLYLKCDGKKVWKKHYFVLRSSGLYYCPKGKSKLSKDLLCLVTFDDNQVYNGFGWKKKYKAPTEFGFGIKHPQVQTKASKYIKYLCAEDERSLRHWITGIRIAKHGRQLLENYRTLLQDMAEDDLETLAQSRSFSMASMVRSGTSSQCTTPCSGPTTPTLDELSLAGSASVTPVSTLDRSWSRRTLSRQESLRSSPTNSDNRPNSASGNYTPTSDHYGFDSDFPTGTIKKKPSVTPKIPLTNTTRTLAKQSLAENDAERISNEGDQQQLCRNGPLRTTLRRSLTDEKISVNEMISTLRRQKQQARKEIPVMEGANGCDVEEHVRLTTAQDEAVDVDCLPLPPPPEFAVSMESLFNIDSLPPPPPEAYNGHDPCVENDNAEEASPTKNKAAAPPVPPPKPSQKAQTASVCNEGEQNSPKILSKSVAKKMNDTPHSDGPSQDEVEPKNVKSPPVLRKIVFRDEVGPRARKKSGLIPPPPPLPKQVNFATNSLRPRASSAACKAPQPPRRSESTRLSCRGYNSVASGTRNPLTPPKTFLADLQRVMEKKWKVAQQLKLDGRGNAHEVMGFRDPPNPSDVLCCATHVDENKKKAALNLLVAVNANLGNCSPTSETNHIYNTVNGIYERGSEKSLSKKRLPPPPPPKRSETTQLTFKI